MDKFISCIFFVKSSIHSIVLGATSKYIFFELRIDDALSMDLLIFFLRLSLAVIVLSLIIVFFYESYAKEKYKNKRYTFEDAEYL